MLDTSAEEERPAVPARAEDRPARSAPHWLRPAAAWLGLLVAGLVLLLGRFDWSGPERPFARRGYLLSAYLFVLTLPLVYGLLRRLCRPRWVATAATGATFVVLTLPYRWLNLDGLYYYAGRDRQWYTVDEVPVPKTRFLPDGPWTTFPHDVALFAVLVLLAVGAALVAARLRNGRRARPSGRALAVVALFALVVLQAFLHAGVRGPYVYMTHYQEPEAANFWYAVSMWGDGEGTVIADQFVFSAMEDYFQGAPREPNNMLIRRPAGFYAAAQFSYFVNAYYVWMVANVLVWLAAALAGYGFARRLAGERAGILMAAMIGCGTGFVAFVGTPGMYLQGYAVVIIALYLLERLVGDDPRPASFVLFAAALGACSLVYDLETLYPVLLLYGLARRFSVKPLVASLAGAYLIYRGFLLVHDVVLDIPVVADNVAQAGVARRAVLDLLRHPSVDEVYRHTTDIAGAFGLQLARMFFVLPLLPALAGIRFLRTRAQAVLVVALTAASLATVAALRIGGLELGDIPRFVYPMYPAVYLLAALALVRLGEWNGPPRLRPALRVAPWIFVAALVVLSNMDAFGYPTMYFEALEGYSPVFTP